MRDAIRGLNTMLAITAVLLSAGPLLMLKPPPWQIRDSVSLIVSFIWLSGAIGLFWRKLWAWWLSVFALSVVVIGFIQMVISAFMEAKAGIGADPAQNGAVIGLGSLMAFFAFLFLLGIIFYRRECLGSQRSDPKKEQSRE